MWVLARAEDALERDFRIGSVAALGALFHVTRYYTGPSASFNSPLRRRAKKPRDEIAAARPPSNRRRLPKRYILKDLSYAIALAESSGVRLEQAAVTRGPLERTAAMGCNDAYYTVLTRAIEKG